MAPEQHRAQRLDASADQYAFCASLFEALIGDVPFRSTTMQKLVEEKLRGAPRLAAGTAVPRRLAAALRRGLHPDRRRRWPSMRALLAALEGKRPRAWWLLPAGAAALGIGWAAKPGALECDADARVDEAWGEPAQQQLRAAMVVDGVPDAETGWRHVHATLDGYARAWADAYDDACDAAAPRGPDPRRQCLQARLRRFTALTQAFARAGPAALDTIDSALTELEPPQDCLDPEGGAAIAEPDAEWVAVDRLLAEAHAELLASQIDRSRELAAVALARAQARGDRRLEAEATFQLGLVEAELERFAAALPQLERAYFLADELGQHRLAARAAGKLVTVISEGSLPEGDPATWEQYALAHLEHADDGRTRGAVYQGLATMQYGKADYARSAELAAQAVQAFTEVYGEHHPGVAAALNNQGLALVSAGRHDEALAVLKRSADIYEATLGKLTPRRQRPVLNIGLALYEMGRASEATAMLDEVLEMARAQPRPQAAMVGRALTNKGLCLLELGDNAGARRALQEAREQIVGSLGEDHPLVPTIDMNIGLAHHIAKEYEAAVRAYERARTAQVEILGPDHPQTARTEHNLGVTLNTLSEHATAAERLRAAKATFESKLGPRSELAAITTNELARSLAGLGEPEAALHMADHAREILIESAGPVNRWVAFSWLYRAIALRHLGRAPEASTALDEAERIVDALPDPDPTLRGDLEIERENLKR
jgi:tetratricopeptide (TPR) repeat protein